MSKTKKPMAPLRIRITSCSKRTWWYAGALGQEFDVNDPGPRMDFVLWEDYTRDKGAAWRHIAQQDCEIVKSNQ
jgi:hypothetical protein